MGEQGGKMVACYLYQLKESGDSPVSSPMDWLQQVAQLPVTQLRPATRSCVAQVMLFYPKLEAAFSVQELDTGSSTASSRVGGAAAAVHSSTRRGGGH